MGVSREPFTQTNLASLKEEFCLNIGELDRIDKSSELPKAFGGQSLSGDAAGKRFDKSGIEIQSKASDASADHFTTQDLITT